MNIRDELTAKVHEMGTKDVKPFWNVEWLDRKPFWNVEWLDRVRAMPDGMEKEAEKEKAFQSIKSVLDAFERGEYEVVDSIDESLTK